MSTPMIAVVGLLEIVALVAIARIWREPRHKHWVARFLWSVFWLVPLFGPLAYTFLTENLNEHPYDSDTML